MVHLVRALSKYASVVTEPQGEGLRFGIVLDDSDYVEFVLHETELRELRKVLEEVFADNG